MRRAAVAALVVVVPATVVNVIGAGIENGLLTLMGFLAVLLGFAYGGYVARSLVPTDPLRHAAVAALGAFAVVQGALVVVALVRGDWPNPIAIVFSAMLAAISAVIGAMVTPRDARPTEGT